MKLFREAVHLLPTTALLLNGKIRHANSGVRFSLLIPIREILWISVIYAKLLTLATATAAADVGCLYDRVDWIKL